MEIKKFILRHWVQFRLILDWKLSLLSCTFKIYRCKVAFLSLQVQYYPLCTLTRWHFDQMTFVFRDIQHWKERQTVEELPSPYAETRQNWGWPTLLFQKHLHFNILNFLFNILNHQFNTLNHHFNILNHHFNILNHQFNILNHHFNVLNHHFNIINQFGFLPRTFCLPADTKLLRKVRKPTWSHVIDK